MFKYVRSITEYNKIQILILNRLKINFIICFVLLWSAIEIFQKIVYSQLNHFHNYEHICSVGW